jgi:predicted acyltransferase
MLASRAYSLDALRGLAILLMVLSGIVPFYVLPAWMYHAQLPPPTHAFDATLAGITWVDLVFPMFLFAMGAAIPLALGRKLHQSIPWYKLHAGIVSRGAMLAFFAIFLQHVRPFTLNPNPGLYTWLTSLAGFSALFLVYIRLPKEWSLTWRVAVRAGGWALAGMLLWQVSFPDASGFRITRSDIILIVLANMAVLGAWVWLWTRENLLLRLGVMGVLLAAILSVSVEGSWIHTLWNTSPAPWVFRFYYLKYLFIIIPGIIAGEQLISWQRALDNRVPGSWSPSRYMAIAALTVALVLICLIGLQLRLSFLTFMGCVAVLGALYLLVRRVESDGEQLLRIMVGWAAFWLVLGLAFEPFEGGIKKDWSTFSYYFVTSGLSLFMLIGFMIVLDYFQRRSWCRWLIESGQNPMIAYVGMMNFIYPVLGITGLDVLIQSLTPSPWAGALRAFLYTLLLAWGVSLLTRRGIFWKT